jgi:hypothetical protein
MGQACRLIDRMGSPRLRTCALPNPSGCEHSGCTKSRMWNSRVINFSFVLWFIIRTGLSRSGRGRQFGRPFWRQSNWNTMPSRSSYSYFPLFFTSTLLVYPNFHPPFPPSYSHLLCLYPFSSSDYSSSGLHRQPSSLLLLLSNLSNSSPICTSQSARFAVRVNL